MKRPDASIEDRFAASVARVVAADEGILLAVSGGPDSMMMLELAARTQVLHPRVLSVAHVDHGIHPDSASVASTVRSAAARHGLPYYQSVLQLERESSETTARVARRRALGALGLESGAAVVMLAHHADDQAETVLMRLLRGSGPAGLAGMSPRRGIWVRPLLDVARVELEALAEEWQVPSWQDPANRDGRHLRSWLRHQIIPPLTARLPDVRAELARSGRLAASARHGWDLLLEQLPALDLRIESHGISVAALPLRGYRSPLRHAILAALGRRAGVRLGERRLRTIDQLIGGEHGSRQVAVSAHFRAELAFGRLAFFRVAETQVEAPKALRPGQPITFGGCRLETTAGVAGAVQREGNRTALEPAEDYLVRPWRAGDRIRPLGSSGTRPVAVLLKEGAVPPSRREEWPVVVAEAEATIVWVPGICRSGARIPAEGTEAWNVDCVVS